MCEEDPMSHDDKCRCPDCGGDGDIALREQAMATMRQLNDYDRQRKRAACQAPACGCVRYCTSDGRRIAPD